MKNITKQAFTLVELIVVITILAVLGTIAVISLQNYTLNARDSVRVHDLNTIKSSIEYTRIELGKYIVPDDGTDITYSGSIVVRNQGTFGKQAQRKTKRLDKVPLDPLTQDEYTFSVTANKAEFELGAIMEGDDIVQTTPILLTNTYAASSHRAYVNGTYNGKIAKASSGSVDYIFAIPSIISTDLTNPDIIYQATNKQFVMKGYPNIPSSYSILDGSTIDPQEIDFVNPTKLVVFSGSFDDIKKNDSDQIIFLSNIQQAYSGTTIKNNSEIKKLLEINTITNPEGTKFLAQSLIKAGIDRKYEITASNVTPYNPIASNCLTMTTEMVSNLNVYFSGALNLTKNEWCNKTAISLPDWNFTFQLSGMLPAEIGNLNKLTIIDIKASWHKPGNITGFPDTIKLLTNLKSITITENKIDNIEKLVGLNNLEFLFINNVYNHNQVDINNLGLFKNLEYLSYFNTNVKINNLFEFFDGNSPLENLHLSEVIDSSIPDNIEKKTNFKNLSLAGTFSSIPSTIGNLTDLTSLAIGGERSDFITPNITQLPSEIGQLNNLKYLTVSRTQITDFPESFSNLTKLERLSIGFNEKLTSLFSDIGDLSDLYYIRAQANELRTLPESMVNLTKITYFYVDFNGTNYYLYNLLKNYNNGDNFCEENIMKSGANTCISKNGGIFSFSLIENGGYTLNADKTVLSANGSSLFWQTHKLNSGNAPSYEDIYLWGDAEIYCNDLVLGGMNNWRMPTFVELRYLIDTRFSVPMVDQTYLSAKNEKYWSTTIGSGTQKRQTLDFTDGTKSFYGESIFPSYSHTKRPVRCVHD